MKTEQLLWQADRGWQVVGGDLQQKAPHLVLAFGTTDVVNDPRRAEACARYPGAITFGCSTAGEIQGGRVHDNTIALTAVHFEHTRVRPARVSLDDIPEARAVGQSLARSLADDDLVHVLVLSDGLHVNGSQLTLGFRDVLPAHVAVTGGLSGDGDRFARTLVWSCDFAAERVVVALGLYGSRLRVGYGSLGGWDPFGPERLITKSDGAVLYELDGQSALSLYKKYLGANAAGLPARGLLFPLSIRDRHSATRLVRTILAVDETAETMTFAGDMPEGSYARLMKANFERLIDGAAGAASIAIEPLGTHGVELALLISCVGRKLVLKQRVEEEIESVREVVGDAAAITGFYSYGEVCPVAPNAGCELHNQTMTITTFSEK